MNKTMHEKFMEVKKRLDELKDALFKIKIIKPILKGIIDFYNNYTRKDKK